VIVRRLTAAVSVVLLAVLAIAIAEATLISMLAVFSAVLRLDLSLEFGDRYLQTHGQLDGIQVGIRNAGTIGSILLTTLIAVVFATWQFRQWRPVT
jgi:phosphoglycerate dehydrogenase-like enzyme